jgi:hypothetical protein
VSEFRVIAHILPGYSGGRLHIKRESLELVLGSFLGATDSIRHARPVVHWIRLRIAWPWMNSGPVIASTDRMAVALVPPFKRAQAKAELEAAGFEIRNHSVWSYSRKSLTRMLAQES